MTKRSKDKPLTMVEIACINDMATLNSCEHLSEQIKDHLSEAMRLMVGMEEELEKVLPERHEAEARDA